MKKLITIILLTAALCISAMPAVFAADTVTAADVEAIMAKNALINNEADYEIYKAAIEKDEHSRDAEKYITPEYAYLQYSQDNGIDEKENYFIGKDSKTTDIKSALNLNYNPDEHLYRCKDMTTSYKMVGLYLIKNDFNMYMDWGTSGMTLDAETLYLDSEALARIINENKLEKVEEIILFQNPFVDYEKRDIFDLNVILIETENEEYVITDVKYTNGELSHYSILDGEAFIEAMQGNYGKAREQGYERLTVKKSPAFSDIADDSTVSLLARMGIVSGYEDGTFGGDRYVTRAEAAVMIARLAAEKRYNIMELTVEDDYEKYNMLTDVPFDYWASGYIQYGYTSGYISGVEPLGKKLRRENVIKGYIKNEDGRWVEDVGNEYIDMYAFHPEDYVTEQELVKMIVCAIDIFGDEMAGAEGGWPDGYVSVAKRLGICDSASDRMATRLTAAHMLRNALDASVNRYLTGLGDKFLETGIRSDESIYEKVIFYNKDWTAKRVRLTGKITATSDTYSTLREKEVKFVVGEDVSSYIGDYKKGEELTLLVQYDDVRNYVNHDCTAYCELLDGNLTVVMADV